MIEFEHCFVFTGLILCTFFSNKNIFLIEVQLIYDVLISAVHQNDSVIHIYILSFFYILSHYGLSQEIGYSSLCYTVGPCLSIPYVISKHM